MDFQPSDRSLRKLVEEFNQGAILLPQFQRDYVWGGIKIRNLLDSLLRGFPIGCFYLWQPPDSSIDPKSKAFGNNQFLVPAHAYLIDGQQRLTSLEAAFGLFAGEDKAGQELICYLDLAVTDIERARDTKLFVSYGGNKSVAARAETGDSTLINVRDLFNGFDPSFRNDVDQRLTELKWDKKRIDVALRRLDAASKMLDQRVPCITIKDVSDQEAVEIFSRLNKGGTALSQGDVKAAELARGTAVEVLKRIRTFVTEERPKRLGFGFSFAFRALVLFHQGSSGYKSLKTDWVNTNGAYDRNLATSWAITEKALTNSLQFVENIGWTRKALLPSAIAVIILAAALEKEGYEPSAQSIREYTRWLCLTALRGSFQASVETTINRFYKAVMTAKTSPSTALLKSLGRDGLKIKKEEFNRYAQPWGPATLVMYAWLVHKGATDWLTGAEIRELSLAGSATFPGGDLSVHHIFPRKVIIDARERADDANCPANYALISRPTNSEFSDNPPSDILAQLNYEQRSRASIQFFGIAAGDQLTIDKYEDFCDWRSKNLVAAINEWLGLNDPL